MPMGWKGKEAACLRQPVQPAHIAPRFCKLSQQLTVAPWGLENRCAETTLRFATRWGDYQLEVGTDWSHLIHALKKRPRGGFSLSG